MCECDLCKRLRYYKELGIPEEVIDCILNTEMDLDYLNAIMDGSWPNGKQILESIEEI